MPQPAPTTRRWRRGVARTVALLLAAPLLLLGLVATSSPAYACSCAPATFKQQVNRADTIFLGRVRETGRDDDGNIMMTVLAQRIYDGALDQPLVEVTTPESPATCGVGELPEGERYLFFVREGITTICDGTAPASRPRIERLQQLLGPGSEIAPPRPEANFDPVSDSEPPELSRLLAPGGAAVLIGLLGLLVARRRVS